MAKGKSSTFTIKITIGYTNRLRGLPVMTLYPFYLKNCFQRKSLADRARPRSELGRHSLWYRGPLIWNFLNNIINVPDSVHNLKTLVKTIKAWRPFLLTKKHP